MSRYGPGLYSDIALQAKACRLYNRNWHGPVRRVTLLSGAGRESVLGHCNVTGSKTALWAKGPKQIFSANMTLELEFSPWFICFCQQPLRQSSKAKCLCREK